MNEFVVSEFVDECRREWRRLRVPDPVADEMAADLAADLEEAEAEGVPAEEVLGSAALDPRSFAASWAAERGVARPSSARLRVPTRSFILAAIAPLVAIAISGAVLMLLASPSGPRGLVPPPPRASPSGARILAPLPPPASFPSGTAWVVVAAPLDTNGSGLDRTAGSVLLIVGLAGIVLLTLFWFWLTPGRRTHIDGRPTGFA
jgi:hypothetical protein